MDPVVEDAEIGIGRPAARAHDEGDLGDRPWRRGARRSSSVKASPMTRLAPFCACFAQHAAEIRGLHILRPVVVDAEIVLGLQQRDMDLVDPGLLDRRAEDAGDLERIGAQRAAAGECQSGGAQRPQADELAPIDGKQAVIG